MNLPYFHMDSQYVVILLFSVIASMVFLNWFYKTPVAKKLSGIIAILSSLLFFGIGFYLIPNSVLTPFVLFRILFFSVIGFLGMYAGIRIFISHQETVIPILKILCGLSLCVISIVISSVLPRFHPNAIFFYHLPIPDIGFMILAGCNAMIAIVIFYRSVYIPQWWPQSLPKPKCSNCLHPLKPLANGSTDPQIVFCRTCQMTSCTKCSDPAYNICAYCQKKEKEKNKDF
jgi:hypothetical protein